MSLFEPVHQQDGVHRSQKTGAMKNNELHKTLADQLNQEEKLKEKSQKHDEQVTETKEMDASDPDANKGGQNKQNPQGQSEKQNAPEEKSQTPQPKHLDGGLFIDTTA